MAVQERRRRERAQRHSAIVRAARELGETEGWDAVTTRRLAERIEYSQPVLYGHFANKDAIVAAVALEGFAELADALRRSRLDVEGTAPTAAPAAVARAYAGFAAANPALYDAMFTLGSSMRFADPDRTPAALHAGFGELRAALAPLAGDRDPDTLTEVVWSALHGLVTLARNGRLRADQHEQRLGMLVDLLRGDRSV